MQADFLENLTFIWARPWLVAALFVLALAAVQIFMYRRQKRIAKQEALAAEAYESPIPQKTKADLHPLITQMQQGCIMLDAYGTIAAVSGLAQQIFGVENAEGKSAMYVSRNIAFNHKAQSALEGRGGQMTMELERSYSVRFIPAGEGAVILLEAPTPQQSDYKIQREFFHNVSREFQRPLSVIDGFAELMGAAQAQPEDRQHFAQEIKAEVQRMTDIIENVLFLSGDETETAAFVDMGEVAAEAMENLREAAEEKELTVQVSATPCPILGNRRLLYEMCRQLIANAIQYNVKKGWLKIAMSQKEDIAYIMVEDSGIGIPKAEQHRVLEGFHPIEGRGAGLGLSIVRHVVRYHKGTLKLDSEADEGTRVFIRLPISLPQSAG